MDRTAMRLARKLLPTRSSCDLDRLRSHTSLRPASSAEGAGPRAEPAPARFWGAGAVPLLFSATRRNQHAAALRRGGAGLEPAGPTLKAFYCRERTSVGRPRI